MRGELLIRAILLCTGFVLMFIAITWDWFK